jgi:hypothetical protein
MWTSVGLIMLVFLSTTICDIHLHSIGGFKIIACGNIATPALTFNQIRKSGLWYTMPCVYQGQSYPVESSAC